MYMMVILQLLKRGEQISFLSLWNETRVGFSSSCSYREGIQSGKLSQSTVGLYKQETDKFSFSQQ